MWGSLTLAPIIKGHVPLSVARAIRFLKMLTKRQCCTRVDRRSSLSFKQRMKISFVLCVVCVLFAILLWPTVVRPVSYIDMGAINQDGGRTQRQERPDFTTSNSKLPVTVCIEFIIYAV